MTVNTDRKRIEEILNRGVVSEILPSREEFVKVLCSGKKLRIYIGADPTSESLHLSHAKNYLLLEELRQLGHEVIVLVGDFTAQIGDPSGRSATRNQMTEAEVKKNVKSWLSQIKPLMNFKDKKNPPRFLYNSQWLKKLSFKDIISLASNFTVQQMIERDMFEKRLEENVPIHLHEFLYPLMQGYDSVAMDVDVELCGTDQIFNALAGRTLLKRLKNKDKFVVAVNLMANPKTGEMMSKSRGTGVFLSSPPDDMFGAIMAQPDEMIEVLYVNCTRLPLSEKDSFLAQGPREAKAKVAFDIVKRFYGEAAAKKAEERFVKTFSKKELPEDLPQIQSSSGTTATILMVGSGVIKSNGEAWRLAQQGGFEIDGKVVKDAKKKITVSDGQVVRIGKKSFFRIKTKD
ncbi:MAG TPA: tyrosine--tRNA ligase [Candidatus Paceibacterota bacterium]|nr:tyrosine--tRNA ligase [Candidatus Paceibacterota bacterium]